MRDSVLYWIWLAELFGQGNTIASKIAQNYNAESVFEGCLDEIESNLLFTDDEIKKISNTLKNRSLSRAEDIMIRCEKLGITVITPDSYEYPAPLRSLRDMPVVLYSRGRLPDCNANMLTTVVGTRNMTEYGRCIAYSLGTGLALGGSIVVSGMALGADSMALIGALEHGGKTIAVLGSGVDVIYPREHREIYNRILSIGAVISEYPPGTPPTGHHFPVRNRIMSGLSDATVVVEADAKSGSLITAKTALKQGRKLFAVPGKVGESGAEGTNMLICDGAIPTLTAEDILAEFEFVYKDRISVQNAHSLMHGLNMEALSSDAMYRARVGSGSGHPNYIGSGSYGGRFRDAVKPKRTQLENEIKSYCNTDDYGTSKDEKSNLIDIKENNYPKKEKQTVNSDKKIIQANKIELDTLDETEIKVYNKMKPSVPLLPDDLVDSELPVSEVMGALTMLEMAGAVESGGGGYFMRISEDDIMQSPND